MAQYNCIMPVGIKELKMKRFIKNAINVEPIREFMAKNRLNIRDFSKVCGVSERVLGSWMGVLRLVLMP